uniref:Cytochrome b n=2 Tax=Hyalomma marginatum TaxID=34627 RepID=A0A889ZDG3_9ACAR|nr:cytochrome b [Hyalomma marginatum]QRE78570.1 cytochrome b [Hyalomma marginatum]QRF92782.1 cytochrome b [Hyalomma marginatum]QRF92786.1 cytochrome b [Hyalomma marginatum]QRF92799.1 cytochrome b [Hyalomma marginatum]
MMIKLVTPFKNLPTPSNISYMWNFGSLLGMCLMIQIFTGLFLAMNFSSDITTAFKMISHIQRDVNNGWLIRSIHANGASLFFIFLYIHIARGIYYSSFFFTKVWITGILMILMLMGTAFLGYILPWGQMSFWGATVITNLISAIPYVGSTMTFWIWGGFSVDNNTLMRFFTLHFIFPFILTFLVFIHILMIHEKGSSNPLGLTLNIDKIPFHPYFSIKDLMGIFMIMFPFMYISIIYPYNLMDAENFNMANPMITPPHIQPEWYFLFAYAILRSIPNKLGGVIALIMSILILFSFTLTMKNKLSSFYFNNMKKMFFWILVNCFFMLTYLGAMPIEYPFDFMSKISTILYFFMFIFIPML